MAQATLKTSKTRFYKLPAAAKVILGLSKIEGKGKLGKSKDLWMRSEKLNNSENLDVYDNLKI